MYNALFPDFVPPCHFNEILASSSHPPLAQTHGVSSMLPSMNLVLITIFFIACTGCNHHRPKTVGHLRLWHGMAKHSHQEDQEAVWGCRVSRFLGRLWRLQEQPFLSAWWWALLWLDASCLASRGKTWFIPSNRDSVQLQSNLRTQPPACAAVRPLLSKATRWVVLSCIGTLRKYLHIFHIVDRSCFLHLTVLVLHITTYTLGIIFFLHLYHVSFFPVWGTLALTVFLWVFLLGVALFYHLFPSPLYCNKKSAHFNKSDVQAVSTDYT